MSNSTVKECTLNIENKNYTFKLNINAAIKCDSKYGSFVDIFNGLLKGTNFYENAMKMLSCACIEKEWDYEELSDKYPLRYGELQKLDEIVQDMTLSFESFKQKDSKTEEDTEGKNIKASQSTQ